MWCVLEECVRGVCERRVVVCEGCVRGGFAGYLWGVCEVKVVREESLCVWGGCEVRGGVEECA